MTIRLWLLAITLGLCPSPCLAQAGVKSDRHDLLFYLDDAGARKPVKNVADWDRRRRQILANLQKVMGDLPHPEARVPLDIQRTEKVDLGDGLWRHKISYQSEPGKRVPAYLFLPSHSKKKRPAVLCLHQTTNLGKGEPSGLGGNPNLHYALHLAQRGYVTLAPDYPSFGEHAWDFKGKRAYASGTMKAIWDNIRAVDLLQSLPEVDAARIGCIGHSLGGHNALFTAAFETRIAVIVSSCGFTTFLRDDMPSWTGPRYMPRIAAVYQNDPARVPFDFPEILGCLAPRPFLACAALHDKDFDVRGVKECLAAARPIYTLLGKASHLDGYYPDSPHDFPKDARTAAYAFLDKHLQKEQP